MRLEINVRNEEKQETHPFLWLQLPPWRRPFPPVLTMLRSFLTLDGTGGGPTRAGKGKKRPGLDYSQLSWQTCSKQPVSISALFILEEMLPHPYPVWYVRERLGGLLLGTEFPLSGLKAALSLSKRSKEKLACAWSKHSWDVRLTPPVFLQV